MINTLSAHIATDSSQRLLYADLQVVCKIFPSCSKRTESMKTVYHPYDVLYKVIITYIIFSVYKIYNI